MLKYVWLTFSDEEEEIIFEYVDEEVLLDESPREFYYVRGQRKSVKLVYDGYEYVKFMKNSMGVKWICSTKSSTKCRARIRLTTDERIQVLCGEHNHSGYRQKSKVLKEQQVKAEIE